MFDDLMYLDPELVTYSPYDDTPISDVTAVFRPVTASRASELAATCDVDLAEGDRGLHLATNDLGGVGLESYNFEQSAARDQVIADGVTYDVLCWELDADGTRVLMVVRPCPW